MQHSRRQPLDKGDNLSSVTNMVQHHRSCLFYGRHRRSCVHSDFSILDPSAVRAWPVGWLLGVAEKADKQHVEMDKCKIPTDRKMRLPLLRCWGTC